MGATLESLTKKQVNSVAIASKYLKNIASKLDNLDRRSKKPIFKREILSLSNLNTKLNEIAKANFEKKENEHKTKLKRMYSYEFINNNFDNK